MKYGLLVKRPEGLPRELFAKTLADAVYDRVLNQSDADEYRLSLVELENGEIK